jgi:transcriptional antiterminator RfaH
VTIVEGPFAGVNAIFQAESGKERVMLLLDLLGRSNRVQVQSHQIIPAS